MASQTDDGLRRKLAYGDYRRMPNKERSIDALWRSYVEKNRQGEDVPTTNRTKLYQWANEDDWKNQLIAEEKERQEAERSADLRSRKRQMYKFASMLDVANEALLALIQSPDTDQAVRLRAVTALYDRIGYPAESRTSAAKRAVDEASADGAPQSEHVEYPEGEDDAAWSAAMAQRHLQGD